MRGRATELSVHATTIEPPGDPRTDRGRAPIAAAIVLVLVVGVGWFGHDRQLRDGALDDAGASIERLASDRLDVVERWASDALDDARYWAADPVVVAAVFELAVVDDADLVDHPAQRRVRDRLRSFLELNRLAGFFAVAPDGRSLASSRDANVATENLVAVEQPRVFERLLGGSSAITRPQSSDVPLGADRELAETMFAGAPITVGGETVAVLLLRIVPELELGPISDDVGVVGVTHLVVSASGTAVTGDDAIAPLDSVSVGGVAASSLFRSGSSDGSTVGVIGSVTPGGARRAPATERIVGWDVSPELGLGIVASIDAERALEASRFERRASAATAAVLALAGVVLVAVGHRLVRRSHDRELEASRRRFRSLVDLSPDPVLRVRPDGTVLAVNRALLRILDSGDGTSVDVALARSSADPATTIHDLGERDDVLGEISRRWPTIAQRPTPSEIDRIATVRASGERYHRVRLVPVVADAEGEREVLVVVTDVTAHVVDELRLEALALVDSLTGLCNRAAITDRLAHALRALERPGHGTGVAVVVVDLDHFKTVNDAFGHAVGDRVLVEVGGVLAEGLRAHDSIGRVGGDEFVIVCEQVPDRDAALSLTRRLVRLVDEIQISADGSTIVPSASLGVAWTDRPVAPADLVVGADRAMLAAKQRRIGPGFSIADDPASPDPLAPSLSRDLFGALDRGEFEVRYQPIVDVRGDVLGAEALLRWNHPALGTLAPARFLGDLMETGFIGPVGRWGIGVALAQAAAWRDAGHSITMNVNVSPVELASGALDVVARDIERHGLDPSRVCVEITEHAFAGRVLTSGAIARLGDIGVRIALDDFGTGASTLSHLRQRPLHTIKLDRSFVAGADPRGPTSDLDEPILRTIIRLADVLGLGTVAEGVESRTQLAWLHEAGCASFQGWAFAPALPAADFDPGARHVPVDVSSEPAAAVSRVPSSTDREPSAVSPPSSAHPTR
ncbi:putative bifunctional diguanylate cyclase/phosphodiesterase [Ilumatobacter sp.]|uniref:putative bifunctional diguanylate cyclase/phosphodiesterase n=1 Tax=Ilumatobacter sp. TaxID=1967498 RepID=UPI003B52507C